MGVREIAVVLTKITEAFSEREIRWAVGASMMLYAHGLVEEPHDLDLFVSIRDVESVEMIMSGLGELQTWESHPSYGTKRFLEYIIDGVEVDIVAGLVLIGEELEYHHDFNVSIIEYRDGIPYMTLEEWKELYRMMGRLNKVEIIEQHLSHL